MSYEYMTGLGQTGTDPGDFRLTQFKNRKVLMEKEPRATSIPGDPCAPPEGGVVRKFHSAIARTPEELKKIRENITPVMDAGCVPTNRWWDMYKTEVCCPVDTPKIRHLLPLPVVTPPNGNGVTPSNGNGVTPPNGNGVTPPNGNGVVTNGALVNGNGVVTNGALVNGNGVVVAEEKKYFGLTPMQLGMVVAGGAALYFLVIKK